MSARNLERVINVISAVNTTDSLVKAGQLEEALAIQMTAARLPEWEIQYRFAKPRRWALDFAWPVLKLAVEVEGAIWAGGRHTRGSGFQKDVEKYNELAILGWSLLRVTSPMLLDGTGLDMIQRWFKARG